MTRDFDSSLVRSFLAALECGSLLRAARALQLARKVSVGASEIAGTIRISASQPIACVLLPPMLARMRSLLPDIQVELVVSNAITNLLRREADIALRMVQPDQATLVAKRIGPRRPGYRVPGRRSARRPAGGLTRRHV